MTLFPPKEFATTEYSYTHLIGERNDECQL